MSTAELSGHAFLGFMVGSGVAYWTHWLIGTIKGDRK